MAKACEVCEGSGKLKCLECNGVGHNKMGHKCDLCKGAKIQRCWNCFGSGSL